MVELNTIVLQHLPAYFTMFVVMFPEHGTKKPALSLPFYLSSGRLVSVIHAPKSTEEVQNIFIVF